MLQMKNVFVLAVLLLLVSCQQHYSPKPRGYFRIDLPEKSYTEFSYDFPYIFDVPDYGYFLPDTRAVAQPYWANISFPAYRANIHLTYRPINSRTQLESYLSDAHTFVVRHIPKASGIEEELMKDFERRVFGQMYYIKGHDVASSVQFFVTDSVNHFLRGSLYFNVTPNNDSLAPVIHFLKEDVRRIMHTIRWE